MRSLLTLVLLFGVALLVGCGDDDNPSGSTSGKGSMSAKVNGGAWSPTNIQATYSSGVLGLGGTEISGSNSRVMQILGTVAAAGTYQISPFQVLNATYSETAGTSVTTYLVTSGTLKVDEISATGAKGSFSFEAREQVLGGGAGSKTASVTDGTFDVKF